MNDSSGSSRSQYPLRRRLVGLATIVTLLASLPGCTVLRYKPLALKQMDVERDGLVKRRIRMRYQDGSSGTLDVERVDFPYVWGVARDGGGRMRVRHDEILAFADVRLGSDRNATASSRLFVGVFSDFSRERLALMHRAAEGMVLRTAGGEIWIDQTRLFDDAVEGHSVKGRAGRFDLRQAERLEIGETNTVASLGASLGAAAGVFLTIGLIVFLTKESCPFVYVDRGSGPELVGEAYPGAAFRSVQRDDLLALGPLPDGDIHVRLRNEARETQFTDRAELIVVDHLPNIEPVATHDAGVLLLEASSAPLAARVEGIDVTPALREADGRFWERDVVTAARSLAPPAQDSILVDLPLPPAGGSGGHRNVALDLSLGNTALVDLVFGRFFAAMGESLPRYVAEGNEAASGTRITNWLTREGVNLIVEVDDGSGFQRAAVVPPTGPARPRRIAVPVDVPEGAHSVRVRLRSGVGFWRIDSVRIASVLADRRRHAVVAASAATSSREGEVLTAIKASDQVHNALETLDESLDLSFPQPARVPGLARSVFLSTTGYYNIHPPLESQRQIGLLRRVRDRPGALSQLGLDLVRDYLRAAQVGQAGGTR